MYKVIDIIDYDITRDIKVLNEKTGTIDECFDDSDIACKNCFGFVKKGKSYNFKIALFGNFEEEETPDTVKCLINKEVMIGAGKFVEVFIGDDRYYVFREDLPDGFQGDSFFYYYTRKDLIQVDDVIYSRLCIER